MEKGNGKKDPPKKSIFEQLMSPYTETIKSISRGVDNYFNPNKLQKMKPKGIKDIKIPQKPKDAIIHDMKHQYDIEKLNKNRGKGGETKQETERKLKEQDIQKKAKPPHSINKKMIETYENKFDNENYDLIEGDKNNEYKVDGDVGQYKDFGGG